MKLEDIPEIKEGECLRAEIEYDAGAAIHKAMCYLKEDVVVRSKKPAIRVYGGITAGIYSNQKTIELDRIIEFRPLEFSNTSS